MKNAYLGSATTSLIKATVYGALVIATAMITVAAESPDSKTIQGDWKPVKAEIGGQPMTDAVLQMIRLKMNSGKYEVIAEGHPDLGTYTLDAATSPKNITITGTEGPNQGRTFPAIYELDRDTLRICYDLSGKRRPAEFKTLAGTKLYLVTYHRAKK